MINLLEKNELIKLLELLGENINNKEKMIEIIETLEKDLTIKSYDSTI
tara:strand:+ start:6831 stop:6974 length:144 start_codon:yes stop_codon:yes gene_type:complete